MPKSTRSSGGKRGGTITVIDARMLRSSARNARLAFWITSIVVALLTMTVAADKMHPIIAALLGAVIGATVGGIAWALFRIWPVIRLLWWWTPEIIFGLTTVYGWTALARHTNLIVRLAVVALVVGVPAAVPYLRHRIAALVWCLIVRHRLRTCFTQFIIANRSGTLPLVLWARPTPVGERVWLYLRTGFALSDLEARLDKIAVACHASIVIAERASEGNAAYLRLDIKRREVLTATVGSPLVDLVDPNTPATQRTVTDIPTALDLPDVVAEAEAAARQAAANAPVNGRKPAPAASPANSEPTDDISDWI
jgi:hypothetical protein